MTKTLEELENLVLDTRASISVLDARIFGRNEREAERSTGTEQRLTAIGQLVNDLQSNTSKRIRELELAVAEIRSAAPSGGPGVINDELVEELLATVEIIKKLDREMFGDIELRAKWEAGKANYPCIPEPPKGLVGIVDGLIARMRDFERANEANAANFTTVIRRLSAVEEAIRVKELEGVRMRQNAASLEERVRQVEQQTRSVSDRVGIVENRRFSADVVDFLEGFARRAMEDCAAIVGERSRVTPSSEIAGRAVFAILKKKKFLRAIKDGAR